MARLNSRWLSGAVCMVLLVGCSGATQDPNRPKTYPVKGTVTHKGQPVEGAMVTFMAQTPEGRGATGRTDASGQFLLTTFGGNDGAMAGDYKISVSKIQVEGALSQEEAQKYQEKGKPLPPTVTKDLLPAKYKNAATSGLKTTVKADGDNTVKLDLTD